MTLKANLQVKEKNMREIFVIQNHLNVFKCLTIVYLRHNPHLCFDGLKKWETNCLNTEETLINGLKQVEIKENVRFPRDSKGSTRATFFFVLDKRCISIVTLQRNHTQTCTIIPPARHIVNGRSEIFRATARLYIFVCPVSFIYLFLPPLSFQCPNEFLIVSLSS